MKGQTSIETLFLLLVILTATLVIVGLYSQTHDSTMALGIARTEINSLANNMDDLVIIKQVKLNVYPNGDANFGIKTDPSDITRDDFGETNFLKISSQIHEVTKLKQISYKIN